MAELKKGRVMFGGVTSITELIQIIKSAVLKRDVVEFGVRKKAGVSIERARKQANAAALALLDSLEPGATLTPEQRQTLAGYTGEGGIGGSEYEYYTPQHVAGGMWDIMALYGADTGNTLEPSAATGIFHEMKPRGVIMTATEISDTSGRINQLLHPDDSVKISPFEMLARSTADDTFDSVIGNVPFGDSRGSFANLDPEYKDLNNIGHYFVLRTIDKIRPGGMVCLIVPYGMTSGSNHKAFREQVSRKAEFLGAHRLPSGTFNENGTATAVDIWVLRKHPDNVADKILQLPDTSAESLNILWPTFINGLWFKGEGKRFQHGEEEIQGSGKFKRMVIRNDQISNEEMRRALAYRFDSRIDWNGLDAANPMHNQRMREGDKRFINGKWYRMDGGRLVIDVSANEVALDADKFGVQDYSELNTLMRSPRGMLSLSFTQMMNIAAIYPETIPEQYRRLLLFAGRQKPKMRERAWRGSIIGLAISDLQDLAFGTDAAGDAFDDMNLEVRQLVGDELDKHGSPHAGGRVDVSGEGSGPWLRFKASITQSGEMSELVKGELDRTTGAALNMANHEDVIRHLFNDISLDPVSLVDFRANFAGELPEDDNELLAILAGKDGIAITATGDLMPFDRATSGDIGMMNTALMTALGLETDERLKSNYHAQLSAIKEKRKWTDVDNITFKLNSRWLDRRLVLEFLQERGFDEFKYVADIVVEDGKLISDLNYSGRDGVFAGYRYKTVMEKDKTTNATTPVYKRYTPKDPFAAQLENYINGARFSRAHSGQVANLEEDFNVWIRQHDEIDNLTQQYNDAFNAYIPFEHSGASLNLKGISGERTPMDYQNSEVRRVSEDGRGIIGFGTGLGKTTTALALEAFNYENGRCKRTCYVVPKAVQENWYYEAQGFYSKAVLDNFLFVGLNELRDGDGKIKQVPVLDANGNQRYGKDGQPLMRNALALSSSAEVKERMNMIPQSNYRAVIMTKEQYAAIPLRIETIDEHASDVLYAQAEAGRVNLNGDKHSDAKKKNSIRAKAADTGTQKAEDFPYFEDMGFDSVIVDEGHNYRNSYAAGREAAALAYLPTGAQAKSAKDMAVKNAYLMKKYNGRGPVMLTATPLVNSPIDAYNMLSHVVPLDEWKKMGIHTPDDFVKVFGETRSVNVQKLSGEVVEKEGLVGFANLDGLRGIFHRWTTLKTAKDVSAQVKIPEVKEANVVVPMTTYQSDIYEELRQRAQSLSDDPPLDENGDPKIFYDAKGNPIDPETDSVFSIIRDMDRVCTDPDLYLRQITFLFPGDKFDAVKKLHDDLPGSLRSADDEEDEEITVTRADFEVTLSDGYAELIVPDTYEDEVLSRLAKFDLSLSDISHPIPPKYSMLIDTIRKGLANGGKQIIFSDEKSQHGKLKRILASALPIDPDKIGILNATTVADAAKGAKKPKKVKKPNEPGENATNEQLADYYAKKSDYDTYVAALNEVSLGGLEKIAADYQEGRTPLLICNKKAEVGINLHLGTSDMHHLTLPWTPASIDQRNGRGARVGGTQDSVNAHYYCGQGSFDEFRLETLKRKKNWITEILTSDKARMDNADANTMEEMQLLLAANPEEREAKRQAQIAAINAKAKAKAQQRAGINLVNFTKAKHAAANGDPEQLKGQIARHRDYINSLQGELQALSDKSAKLQTEQEAAIAELQAETERGASSYMLSWAKNSVKNANNAIRDNLDAIAEKRKDIADAEDEIRKKDRKLVRIEKSASQIRRLKPELERAIKEGNIDIDLDTLEHADECFFGTKGRVYRKGQVWECRLPRYGRDDAAQDSYLVRIQDLDVDTGIANVRQLWCENKDRTLKNSNVRCYDLTAQTQYSESEVELKAWMFGGKPIQEIIQRMNKAQFHDALRSGDLMILNMHILYKGSEGIRVNRVGEGYGSMSRFNYSAERWFKDNADLIIWPDANDELLKAEVAKAYLASNNLDLAKEFFYMLFGTNYKTAVQDYGVRATPDVIAEAMQAAYNQFTPELSADDSNEFGNGSDQMDYVLRYGAYQNLFIIRMRRKFSSAGWIPAGGYTNTDDFNHALVEFLNQKQAEIDQKTKIAVQDMGLGAYQKFLAQIPASRKEVLATVKELPYPVMSRNYVPSDKFDSDRWVEFLSDAVALELVPQSEVSPTIFTDLAIRGNLQTRINDAYSKQMALPEDERFADARIYSGEVTQEQLDAAKAKREALAAEEATKKQAQTVAGITIKQNATTLLAGRFRNIKMPAGDYWCLQDPDGKNGALYRAKDELKEKYSASFYNGKNPDDECPGAWWLIKTKTASAEDIMAVIAKH